MTGGLGLIEIIKRGPEIFCQFSNSIRAIGKGQFWGVEYERSEGLHEADSPLTGHSFQLDVAGSLGSTEGT